MLGSGGFDGTHGCRAPDAPPFGMSGACSRPRPCAHPGYPGKAFGSNAAAWWGFHYKDLITEPKRREVITIYKIDATGKRSWAKAVYDFHWCRRPIRSGWCTRPSTIPAFRGPRYREGEPRHLEERANSDPAAFRGDRARA
jgi:hypothetical protein